MIHSRTIFGEEKMRTMTISALGLALATGACVSVGPDQLDLSDRVADDAGRFNEAYAQAVNSQILLNVLRARDRFPRHYTGMSGINDAPTVTVTTTGALSNLNVRETANLGGVGALTRQRQVQSRPQYGINPFVAGDLNKGVLSPTDPRVFQLYWTSDWPRDVLLYVLVERATPAAGGEPLLNEAIDVWKSCGGTAGKADEPDGCRFWRFVAAAAPTQASVVPAKPPACVRLAEIRDDGRSPPAAADAQITTLQRSLQAGATLSVTDGPDGSRTAVAALCAKEEERVRLDLGGAGEFAGAWDLRLRSLDDVVFYLGELARLDGGPSGLVRGAGAAAGLPSRNDYLFRITSDREADTYAARVRYRGDRYVAGPPISRQCAGGDASAACADAPGLGDRSSTVLSIVSQLLALNQSPETLRQPGRLITN
jgi:hypothetical protein